MVQCWKASMAQWRRESVWRIDGWKRNVCDRVVEGLYSGVVEEMYGRVLEGVYGTMLEGCMVQCLSLIHI